LLLFDYIVNRARLKNSQRARTARGVLHPTEER
jgi:hypothetical protein